MFDSKRNQGKTSSKSQNEKCALYVVKFETSGSKFMEGLIALSYGGPMFLPPVFRQSGFLHLLYSVSSKFFLKTSIFLFLKTTTNFLSINGLNGLFFCSTNPRWFLLNSLSAMLIRQRFDFRNSRSIKYSLTDLPYCDAFQTLLRSRIFFSL